MTVNPSMSHVSSPSHDLIIESATTLEHALARIIASLRVDHDRAIEACHAERRAAAANLDIVLGQIDAARERYEQLIDEIKKQKIELRGEKGDPGTQGLPGSPGESGAPGAAGTDGRDGRDGLPGVPGERGRDGKDGIHGKDGLGVSDFDVEYDGERKITLNWMNGDRQVQRSFKIAILLYRGTWESDRSYEAQDVVTYGGCGYVARCATTNKPNGDDWQLFVKRGSSGANGKDGERGPIGAQGRDGRDLTQIGADGRKW
jgi:hypothetical protein